MEPLMNQSLYLCGCCKRELPHEAFYTNKRTGTHLPGNAGFFPEVQCRTRHLNLCGLSADAALTGFSVHSAHSRTQCTYFHGIPSLFLFNLMIAQPCLFLYDRHCKKKIKHKGVFL